MTLRNSIFTIFSILLLSCSQQKDEGYEELSAYMQTFGVTPEDSCIYIYIPANQCQNCMLLDGNRLDPKLNNRIRLFSGFKGKTLINFEHFYFDKADKMMELKVLDYGNRIIQFSGRRIKANLVLDDVYKQIDSLATH